MHGNEAGKGGELTHDETTIITGALELTQKTAKDAMTPIASAFCLDANAKLDMNTMHLIMTKGHSRVPVYLGTPSNIIGLILVKNLLTTRPEEEIPVIPVRHHATIRKIPRVDENMPLYSILNEFRTGHSHMAAVVRNKVKTDAMNRSKESQGQVDGKLNSSQYKRRSSELRLLQEDELLTESGHFILLKRSPLSGSGLSILPKDNDKNVESPSQRAKKWERTSEVDMLDLNQESLYNFPPEEEVIGIITMEDVIEELLQTEILDETDGYIDVHNKIKVNMLPAGGVSPFLLSTPVTAVVSPLPSVQNSSPLPSPITLSSFEPTNVTDSLLLAPRATPMMGSSPSFPSPPSDILNILSMKDEAHIRSC